MKLFLKQMGQPIDRDSLHSILMTEEQVCMSMTVLLAVQALKFSASASVVVGKTTHES